MEAKELRIGNWVTENIYEYNFNVRPSTKSIKKSRNILVENIWNEGINLCVMREGEKEYISFDSLGSIPLTEEWLLKFGFVYLEPIKRNIDRILSQYAVNNGKFVIELVSGGYQLYHVEGMFCNLKKNVATTSTIIPHGNIKSVHQLQNLYFALTQTELECKP